MFSPNQTQSNTHLKRNVVNPLNGVEKLIFDYAHGRKLSPPEWETVVEASRTHEWIRRLILPIESAHKGDWQPLRELWDESNVSRIFWDRRAEWAEAEVIVKDIAALTDAFFGGKSSMGLGNSLMEGWGHYPYLGKEDATGAKIVWTSQKDGEVRRTILPTDKTHSAIIRKCNQILAEAKDKELFYFEVDASEVQKIAERFKKRTDSRWIIFPMGDKSVVIHNQAKEGGEDLAIKTAGYHKEDVYDLVKTLVDHKTGRVRPCRGWGKHYKGAKGAQDKFEEGKPLSRFVLTARFGTKILADTLNATTDERGQSRELAGDVLAETDILIDKGLIPPLTKIQQKKLSAFLHTVKNSRLRNINENSKNAIALSRENGLDFEANKSPSSAKEGKGYG